MRLLLLLLLSRPNLRGVRLLLLLSRSSLRGVMLLLQLSRSSPRGVTLLLQLSRSSRRGVKHLLNLQHLGGAIRVLLRRGERRLPRFSRRRLGGVKLLLQRAMAGVTPHPRRGVGNKHPQHPPGAQNLQHQSSPHGAPTHPRSLHKTGSNSLPRALLLGVQSLLLPPRRRRGGRMLSPLRAGVTSPAGVLPQRLPPAAGARSQSPLRSSAAQRRCQGLSLQHQRCSAAGS